MEVQTIRRFQLHATFDLMPRSSLTAIEQAAVEAALVEQKKSTNPKWRVGVAAIAENGKIISAHNEKVGPGYHGEQTALSRFYQLMPVGQKKLKALVVAGAQFDDEVIRCSCPYPDNVGFGQVKPSVWLCGKCLEFIHDCTSGHSDDVDILLVCVTGQILKTSLRSLYTMPHTSATVPIEIVRLPDGGWQVFPVPSTEKNKDNANGNNGH